MKLKLRGFSKETLKKYDDVAENPLLAISPKNQEKLGIAAGDISIGDVAVRLIHGKSDEFVGMTKTLRDNLDLDIGQDVELEKIDDELKIIAS